MLRTFAKPRCFKNSLKTLQARNNTFSQSQFSRFFSQKNDGKAENSEQIVQEQIFKPDQLKPDETKQADTQGNILKTQEYKSGLKYLVGSGLLIVGGILVTKYMQAKEIDLNTTPTPENISSQEPVIKSADVAQLIAREETSSSEVQSQELKFDEREAGSNPENSSEKVTVLTEEKNTTESSIVLPESSNPIFDLFFLSEEAFPALGMTELVNKIETKVDEINRDDQDYLIMLVPPKDDIELLSALKSQVETIRKLHKTAYPDNSLSVNYIKLRSKKELESLGQNLGVDLNVKQNVPIYVLKNRYLSKPTVITLMDLYNDPDKLFVQYRPLNEVNDANSQNFVEYIKDSEEEQLLVLQYLQKSKDADAEFKSMRSNFYELISDGWFSARKNIELFLATDISKISQMEEGVKKIGDHRIQNGDWIMLKKVASSNEANFTFQGRPFQLMVWNPDDTTNLKEDDVIENLSKIYYENNVFVHKDLPMKNHDFSVEVRVDKNKLSDSQLDSITNLTAQSKYLLESTNPELYSKVKFYKVARNFSPTEGQVFEVKVRDNREAAERHKFKHENKDLRLAQQMTQAHPDWVEPHTHEYSFPNNLQMSAENLAAYITAVSQGRVPETYYSQQPPAYERFSRKVVGSTFLDDIVSNPINQIMMIYSKHCASCKRFTPVYEKLAKENISQAGMSMGQPTMFNRMNSDHNKVDGHINFGNTPVFALYREGYKDKPFVFKGNTMTEKIMRDFFSVSLDYDVMNQSIYEALSQKLSSLNLRENQIFI